jgi:hypothetical protein
MGIEPTYAAWEAAVLPLNYTRNAPDCTPERNTATASVTSLRWSARMPASASFFVDVTSSNLPVRTGTNHHSDGMASRYFDAPNRPVDLRHDLACSIFRYHLARIDRIGEAGRTEVVGLSAGVLQPQGV